MAEIQVSQPTAADIFSYGFDRYLNRAAEYRNPFESDVITQAIVPTPSLAGLITVDNTGKSTLGGVTLTNLILASSPATGVLSTASEDSATTVFNTVNLKSYIQPDQGRYALIMCHLTANWNPVISGAAMNASFRKNGSTQAFNSGIPKVTCVPGTVTPNGFSSLVIIELDVDQKFQYNLRRSGTGTDPTAVSLVLDFIGYIK